MQYRQLQTLLDRTDIQNPVPGNAVYIDIFHNYINITTFK